MWWLLYFTSTHVLSIFTVCSSLWLGAPVIYWKRLALQARDLQFISWTGELLDNILTSFISGLHSSKLVIGCKLLQFMEWGLEVKKLCMLIFITSYFFVSSFMKARAQYNGWIHIIHSVSSSKIEMILLQFVVYIQAYGFVCFSTTL